MSFNIEWTNADALTPSPFTVTKDGCHYEVKVDAHHVSDEEMQTLRRYVERLQVENAKLREQLADMPKCAECEAMFNCEDCEAMLDCDECLRADASQKERKRLDYENDKLRELVRVFYHCTTSGECDECPINGGGPVHLMPDTICDTIHDRMRELGIEVDE